MSVECVVWWKVSKKYEVLKEGVFGVKNSGNLVVW